MIRKSVINIAYAAALAVGPGLVIGLIMMAVSIALVFYFGGLISGSFALLAVMLMGAIMHHLRMSVENRLIRGIRRARGVTFT
jgi:hypothetical protein